MATLARKKAVEDGSRLSGPEKAAVVLLALGEDHHELWAALDEEEIKEISQAMSTLGTVSANVVEDLLVEFVSGMSSTGAIMGSFEQTQRLLAAFAARAKGEDVFGSRMVEHDPEEQVRVRVKVSRQDGDVKTFKIDELLADHWFGFEEKPGAAGPGAAKP